MTEHASTFLGPWSNFYVMTGSSAAALTGLMFVVITLVTGDQRYRSSDGIGTFSTPTVVHFSAALLVSAILSAPWHLLFQVATVLALAGAIGVIYLARITFRAQRVSTYKPDLEDWISYTILPFAGYIALLLGAIMLATVPATALFVVAAGVVLLIFVGIHNAWDIVTFIVTRRIDEARQPNQDDNA